MVFMDMFSAQQLWEFTVFGWYLNITMFIFATCINVFKLHKLSKTDIAQLMILNELKKQYIANFVPNSRIIMNFLTIFLPIYSACMNTVFIFYMLAYSGVTGIIKGTVALEKISLVPLVNFSDISDTLSDVKSK